MPSGYVVRIMIALYSRYLIYLGEGCNMTPLTNNEAYAGVNRRSSIERRSQLDRRNLTRFSSLSSGRRTHLCRRKEDEFWMAKKL